MTPRRIQLRRTKGYRKPEGAVVVSRPSRWGNPCRVWVDKGHVWADAPWWGMAVEQDDMATARLIAASALRRHLWAHRDGHAICGPVCDVYPAEEEIRSALAGRDLACWCPLDEPCHADVLLEVANA